jgi:hypothetical protein
LRILRVQLRQGAHQALQGIGLGAAAFLTWLGIAKAKGWVSAPAWGWQQTPMNAVLRSVARQGVSHLAVSWNEAMVFRGYGFETVRAALGQGKAVALLIPGFALYHGLEMQQLLGMLAGGTTLMLLRLHTDALWMPVGYHWGWNVLQTAVFGAPDSAPSIRPLQIQGSERWMGRPGEPEPGLLSTLVQLALALLVWLWIRRGGARRG